MTERGFELRRDKKSRKVLGLLGPTSVTPTLQNYDPPLDEGIMTAVQALQAAGVETFESCHGGSGHAYAEPTVRFHGNRAEGFRALSVAMQAGLMVQALRRVWPVNDGEPNGPWWELTFSPTTDH